MNRDLLRSRSTRVAFAGTVLWCIYATLVLLFAPDLVYTSGLVDTAIAFALGLLMALRVNRAYERWWEARTLWGTLINASRNLAVKVQAFAHPELEEAQRVHGLIVAFAYGLRNRLRGEAHLSELPGLEQEPEDPKHVPSWIVAQLYAKFHDWTRKQRITDHDMRMLDLEARILLEVCGGCEKIHTTSLPPVLTWVTRLAVAGTLMLAAWALRAELGWQLIPLAGLGTFLVLIAETLADAMEHPFGIDLNHLDLSVMCGVIDRSTGEILGVDEAGATGAA